MIFAVSKATYLILMVPLLAVACSGNGESNRTLETKSITVFAASSLGEAFQQIVDEFESKNPTVNVKLSIAGSQRLRTQLELGAAADVFASADTAQMDLAASSGLVEQVPVVFASNSMAVIASTEGDAGVTQLSRLGDQGVTVVLSHPAVPAGAYSRELLANLSNAPELDSGFGRRVLDNVVSEEPNVKNVEQKVVLGEVDTGIVYATSALTAVATGRAREVPIPDGYNVRATYPAAVLAESSNREWAWLFVEFVRSDAGQRVLASHGFGPP